MRALEVFMGVPFRCTYDGLLVADATSPGGRVPTSAVTVDPVYVEDTYIIAHELDYLSGPRGVTQAAGPRHRAVHPGRHPHRPRRHHLLRRQLGRDLARGQAGLADRRYTPLLRRGLRPLAAVRFFSLCRGLRAAGLHHLRSRHPPHRANLPRLRGPSQPLDVLVPGSGAPRLRDTLPAGHVPGHRSPPCRSCPKMGRRVPLNL